MRAGQRVLTPYSASAVCFSPSPWLEFGRLATLGARLSELSAGGASIAGAPPAPVGTRGTLQLESVGFVLPCVVRDQSGDVLRLEFLLDAAIATDFAATVERLAAGRAA
jgi:hypothetical protein